MTRPTRLVLMLGSLLSTVFAVPAPSDAGLIPWAYNAIFGPVGSMRYRTAYAPMYGGTYGYGAYGSYTGYAPMSNGYVAPAAYTGTAMPSYGGGGCSSCNQTSYYAPQVGSDGFYGNYPSYADSGQSCCNCPAGNCSTGNCASGNCSSGNCSAGCTNCSANMSPLPYNSGSNTSGYGPNPIAGPVPDPNNTRDVNTRLIEMENRINRDEHRWNEIEKFLKKFHKDEYAPARYPSESSTYETVPPRHKSNSFESENANPENHVLPRTRKPRDVDDPLEEGVRKLDLSAPVNDEKTKGQEKEESSFKESEPVTLRLQDRMTTQAVAPRERMVIVTKQGKTAIANSNKRGTRTSEPPRLPELARN